MSSGNEKINSQDYSIGYDSAHSNFLFVDVVGFIALVIKCYQLYERKAKEAAIHELLSCNGLIELYKNNDTNRKVLCESDFTVYIHELNTAQLLTAFNYDIIFAPKGMFKRNEKRFDVFLLRTHILLKADLKAIHSKLPRTIGKRIEAGADQASIIVLHIVSDISKKDLIEGLRRGTYKNKMIKEIILLYKKKMYRLPKALIENNRIFQIIT